MYTELFYFVLLLIFLNNNQSLVLTLNRFRQLVHLITINLDHELKRLLNLTFASCPQIMYVLSLSTCEVPYLNIIDGGLLSSCFPMIVFQKNSCFVPL